MNTYVILLISGSKNIKFKSQIFDKQWHGLQSMVPNIIQAMYIII